MMSFPGARRSGRKRRRASKIGYVGEDGLECDEDGKWGPSGREEPSSFDHIDWNDLSEEQKAEVKRNDEAYARHREAAQREWGEDGPYTDSSGTSSATDSDDDPLTEELSSSPPGSDDDSEGIESDGEVPISVEQDALQDMYDLGTALDPPSRSSSSDGDTIESLSSEYSDSDVSM